MCGGYVIRARNSDKAALSVIFSAKQSITGALAPYLARELTCMAVLDEGACFLARSKQRHEKLWEA